MSLTELLINNIRRCNSFSLAVYLLNPSDSYSTYNPPAYLWSDSLSLSLWPVTYVLNTVALVYSIRLAFLGNFQTNETSQMSTMMLLHAPYAAIECTEPTLPYPSLMSFLFLPHYRGAQVTMGHQQAEAAFSRSARASSSLCSCRKSGMGECGHPPSTSIHTGSQVGI